MKRIARVKLDYLVMIDDDRDGVPFIDDKQIVDLIVDGLKSVVPRGVLLPGARVELSLTRESLNAIRAAHKKERHAGR